VSWDQSFSNPIMVPRRETIGDAPRRRAIHHQLPKAEHHAEEWQAVRSEFTNESASLSETRQPLNKRTSIFASRIFRLK
jgi:hypothetical protein